MNLYFMKLFYSNFGMRILVDPKEKINKTKKYDFSIWKVYAKQNLQ